GVKTLPRVGMFVKRRPVETSKPMWIGREVTRHPVEQQTNAGAVARIDKSAKIVGRPIPASRREQRDRLVPPRTIERVFGDRHDFDMSETHVGYIRDELIGQLAVSQIPSVFREIATPRAEMDLVDRDRRFPIVVPPPI